MKADLRCSQCQRNKCAECLDFKRVAVGLEPGCPCTRKNHPRIEVNGDLAAVP